MIADAAVMVAFMTCTHYPLIRRDSTPKLYPKTFSWPLFLAWLQAGGSVWGRGSEPQRSGGQPGLLGQH